MVLAGYLTHLALDLAKDNLGAGAILLFFPSMGLWELGLYPPEASLSWFPAAVAILLGAEWIRSRLGNRP